MGAREPDEPETQVGHPVAPEIVLERCDGRIGHLVSPEVFVDQVRRMARGDQGPARIDDDPADIRQRPARGAARKKRAHVRHRQ